MISIIIPTYNREITILRSLQSVLSQTYQDFEIIIVDDNSSDNTEELIMNIKDNRIKYVKNDKNYGACYARNRGIKEAKGQYIAFQDSDDEWLQDKLEKQLKYLIDEEVDIVGCSFWREDRGKKFKIPLNYDKSKNVYNELIKENFISTQTLLGKRECFEKEMFDESLPRFQDWELILRMAKRFKIGFIDQPLVNVYLQNDSITNSPNKAVIALKIIINKNMDYLEKNPKILSMYYRMIGYLSLRTSTIEEESYKLAYKYDKNIKNIIDYVLIELKLYTLLKYIHK